MRRGDVGRGFEGELDEGETRPLSCGCRDGAWLRWSHIRPRGALLCFAVVRREQVHDLLVFVGWENAARQRIVIRRLPQ